MMRRDLQSDLALSIACARQFILERRYAEAAVLLDHAEALCGADAKETQARLARVNQQYLVTESLLSSITADMLRTIPASRRIV
jgi:hypothetical protein